MSLPQCNVTDDGDRKAITRTRLKWEGTWLEFKHDSGACSHYEFEMDSDLLERLRHEVEEGTYFEPPQEFAANYVDERPNGDPIARIVVPRRSEDDSHFATFGAANAGLGVTFMYSGDRDFW